MFDLIKRELVRSSLSLLITQTSGNNFQKPKTLFIIVDFCETEFPFDLFFCLYGDRTIYKCIGRHYSKHMLSGVEVVQALLHQVTKNRRSGFDCRG